jgi:hypothetical protein
MSRRTWTAFAVVQLVGVVCVWSGPRILTAPGPVLFLSGLVLLAPGGLLSLVLVEKLLWSSRLTLSGMNVGRAGSDAGDQYRPVVVGSEGMESNPFPTICRGRILTV